MDVYRPFGTFHPTNTAKPAVPWVGDFRHIDFFTPGKYVHGAQVITLTASDTFFIYYLYVHVISPPSSTPVSGPELLLVPS
jgi:hypothetical protein